MNKAIKSALALVGGVAVLGGAVLGGLQLWGSDNVKPSTWIHDILSSNDAPDTSDYPDVDAEEGLLDYSAGLTVISGESNELISLCAVPLTVEAPVMDYDPITSRLITARVSSSLANPVLDWTIENPRGGEVTELTVSAVSDDTYTAVITCNAAFEDPYYVKATIRGLTTSATAVVYYTGIPTAISVLNGNVDVSQSGLILEDSAYSLEIHLSNPFGAINEKYCNFELVSVQKFGSIFVGTYYTNAFDSSAARWENIHEVEFDKIADEYGGGSASNDAATFKQSDETLIVCSNGIANYYFSMSASGMSAAYSGKFYALGSAEPYYVVTVRENVSGLTTSFEVRFDPSSLSSVSFDQGKLEF